MGDLAVALSTIPETLLEELKRYMCFGEVDEAALRSFLPSASPHFAQIIERFYRRIKEHPDALGVLGSDEQVQRLKGTLRQWLELLLQGPWDAAYYERRTRIGQVHVQISLPQRYMFGAMNLIRGELHHLVESEVRDSSQRIQLTAALNKILDIELAIMLESYRQAFVEKVQRSERLQREDLARQLALSEARYDEIVEKAEALISTADDTGKIVLFNAKCEQVTGLGREAAAGKRWLEIFVQEAERDEVAKLQQQVIGERGQQVSSYEGPVPTDDDAYHRVRWHFTTLPGTTPSLCAIGIDVTNEHELSVRTRRAERLAALGTMAAGLAHEIRNPLNSAHLQLNVARRRLSRNKNSESSNVIKAVELAETEMKRLASLVQDFLQFARPQPLRLSQVDLRSTAEMVIDLISHEANNGGVDVRLEPGTSVRVEADEEKVKQILLNLVRNSVEATGKGGHVLLRLRESDAIGEITIEDDGPGWPEDAPIFEPFFTTKDTGTGLGLAIVHRIVMDHGGTLNAHSRRGRTVFAIQLPRSREEAAVRP